MTDNYDTGLYYTLRSFAALAEEKGDPDMGDLLRRAAIRLAAQASDLVACNDMAVELRQLREESDHWRKLRDEAAGLARCLAEDLRKRNAEVDDLRAEVTQLRRDITDLGNSW